MPAIMPDVGLAGEAADERVSEQPDARAQLRRAAGTDGTAPLLLLEGAQALHEATTAARASSRPAPDSRSKQTRRMRRFGLPEKGTTT
jgi:hypothetical protein